MFEHLLRVGILNRNSERRREWVSRVRSCLLVQGNIQAGVYGFPSAGSLEESGPFQICIICDSLRKEAAIRLRRMIREHPETRILFVVDEPTPKGALRASGWGATGYLRASCSQEELRRTMDLAVAELGQYRGRRMAVSGATGMMNLPLAEIVYLKSAGHRIHMKMKSGETKESKCLRASFGRVAAPLEEEGYYRCHDSYAVNLIWAAKLLPEGLLLQTGEVIPVSTKKRKEIHRLLRRGKKLEAAS